MNWTKTIRTAAIATGMAALLTCTASVRSQEIENTDFDAPNTVAMQQPTAMNQTATQTAPANTTTQVASDVQPVQEDVPYAMPRTEAWTVVGLGSIALLLAVAGRKRMKTEEKTNEATANEWVAFPAQS
jgi:hypothetical protein